MKEALIFATPLDEYFLTYDETMMQHIRNSDEQRIPGRWLRLKQDPIYKTVVKVFYQDHLMGCIPPETVEALLKYHLVIDRDVFIYLYGRISGGLPPIPAIAFYRQVFDDPVRDKEEEIRTDKIRPVECADRWGNYSG
jgi:hypothetical protein